MAGPMRFRKQRPRDALSGVTRTIYIDRDLWAWVTEQAMADRRSTSQWLCMRLESLRDAMQKGEPAPLPPRINSTEELLRLWKERMD